MAVIRDMIPAFELFQPSTLEDALNLLDEYGKDGWALAGGLDSLDWFKDRIKRPKAVIDLAGIESLRGVRAWGDGIEIGALTTLTDVERNEDVQGRYGLLSQAVALVATPQIRNAGTIGGNICQDTRCWYYRSGWPCYRAGGNTCYASAPQAMNREHCVVGARRCVAVNPSDVAPALIALDAQMVIAGRRGERMVDAEDFFIGPAIDITRMNVIEPGEALTSIRIPSDWAGADFYFEKVRDRQAWDWALVSVASAMVTSGGTIERTRVAVNGIAPYPVRMAEVERVVTGRSQSEATADAGAAVAANGAKPLRHNDYKVPLIQNLVRRSLRAAEA